MRSLEVRRKGYIKLITQEVIKLIAKSENIGLESAHDKFVNSRTYNYLVYSKEPFTDEGPEDFFEMYENDRKYGKLLTDVGMRVWYHHN